MTMLHPYLALSVIVLSTVLNAVGTATPDWSVGKTFTMGLWQKCDKDSPCSFYNAEKGTMLDTLRTCQFFALVGITLNLISCLVGFFMVKSKTEIDDEFNNWPLFAFLGCLASATALLILLVVWYITVHNTTNTTVGYSYILSTAAGFGMFVGGILAFFTTST